MATEINAFINARWMLLKASRKAARGELNVNISGKAIIPFICIKEVWCFESIVLYHLFVLRRCGVLSL